MATVPSYMFKVLVILLLSTSAIAQENLEKIASLPDTLKEISGLEKNSQGDFWAINDSGNEPIVYRINLNGVILKETRIKGATNVDWEDLAVDKNGYLYIADIGNNNNKRKDLTIYKVKEKMLYFNSEVEAEKITVSYKNQHAFPPRSNHKIFDAEALIHYDNRLVLFTKNRTKPYNGFTYVYHFSDSIGHYSITPLDSFKTGIIRENSWITGATISANERHIILLSHDNIWVISDFFRTDYFSGMIHKMGLGHLSQKESLCFIDDTTLLIADERYKGVGQNLYKQNLAGLFNQVDSIRKYEVALDNKVFADTIKLQLKLKQKSDVYFELYDTFGYLLDHDKMGYYDKGIHNEFIVPGKLINASYLLNIIVQDRPHAFMLRKYIPLTKEEESESIQKLQKGGID